MTTNQTEPLESLQDLELDDLMSKEKIEQEAIKELKFYDDPLIALITAKMMKNKAEKMAEYVMTRAVNALKSKPKGKFEWMGVNVSLVKGRSGDWFPKTLDEVVNNWILSEDKDLTTEIIEAEKVTIQEGYEKDMQELLELEKVLFEAEQVQDRAIADIRKIHAEAIAFAQRDLDEKKTKLIRDGKADVTVGEMSAKVVFPTV